jgi:hypothetical protein
VTTTASPSTSISTPSITATLLPRVSRAGPDDEL